VQNLLMIYALMQNKNLRNKKVVVPAIAWSTTVAPLLQLGLEPIVCDVDENLSLDINEFEKIVKKYDPSTLMLVHPLGFSADMFKLQEICNTNDIVLLEDTCESLGSDYMGMQLGTFGLMSTFSFFVSHHITSIEGGMICTNDKELYNILKMIRSHGWDRDLNRYEQHKLRADNEVSDFNALYTFYYPSFNVRGTELNAVLGLEQLKRLDDISISREDNFWEYTKNMKENDLFAISSNYNHLISNFAYPVIHKDKEKIVKALIDNGVECRPIVCGNIANQPFLKGKLKYHTETPIADLVDEYGFYVPNHPHLNEEDINYIINIIKQALEN